MIEQVPEATVIATQTGLIQGISSGTIWAGIGVAIFKDELRGAWKKLFRNGNGNGAVELDKSAIEDAQHVKDTVDDTKQIVVALSDDMHGIALTLTKIETNTRR